MASKDMDWHTQPAWSTFTSLLMESSRETIYEIQSHDNSSESIKKNCDLILKNHFKLHYLSLRNLTAMRTTNFVYNSTR